MRAFAIAAASLLLAASPALSQPLTADTPVTLPGGATALAPAGWTASGEGAVRHYTAPEGDLTISIADGLSAPDAGAAIAEAWRRIAPDFTLKPKLITANNPTRGWEESANADYEFPPNDKRLAFAAALRKGNAWTVITALGSTATFDKRGAAVSTLGNSLRAAGYARDNFAGKAAHPLDAARVAALRSFLASSMEQLGVPGAAFALIQDGRVVAMEGLGVRELGKPARVDPDTQFMIASNTKGLSTLMLATLVDEGKLRWDEPVTTAYPTFRLGDDATTAAVRIRNLVCACTGLPRKDLDWIYNTPRDTDPAKVFTLLAATQPTSRFGEVFQYNNLITTAGGFIGGHIAYPRLPVGDAYDRAMQARVFGPLGMTNTHFSFARALAADHAAPHGFDAAGRVAVASNDLAYSIVPYRPAGGAWSTVRDMARYAALELSGGVLPSGKRLVSEANLMERRKPGISTGEDISYGMGLFQSRAFGTPIIFHGGSMPGYQTNFWVLPEAKVAAVLLTNSDSGALLLRPALRRLLELLYDARPEAANSVATIAAAQKAQREEERKTLAVPPDAALAAALAPAYASPDLGHIRVERNDKEVRFHFTDWSSAVASRRNADGTVSFITVDPAIGGETFVVGTDGGKRILTLRDSQHEYRFTEQPR